MAMLACGMHSLQVLIHVLALFGWGMFESR